LININSQVNIVQVRLSDCFSVEIPCNLGTLKSYQDQINLTEFMAALINISFSQSLSIG